jgi:hypothetical protein
MTKIVGVEGMTGPQLKAEIQNGGKFVVYQYCISILILTFRRGSDIYFIRSGESAVAKGLIYTLISLVLGWWGIPWGPIYTIGAFITNFGGGKDVTQAVLASMGQAVASSQ